MLYKKLTEGKQPTSVSLRFFEENAINYLDEVYQLMNGDIVCFKCRKTMNYHNDLKTLLPPTVRMDSYTDRREVENDFNISPKYLH